MKVLPILLFILPLHDVICNEMPDFSPYKPLLKYPKKTKPSAKKNMKILLSRKYVNDPPMVKKENAANTLKDGYTVFPVIGGNERKIYDVPDSPYFPIDTKEAQNRRVKKVLSDYVLTALRKKRSADSVAQQTSNKKPIAKDEGNKQKSGKPNTKEIKAEAKIKKAQRSRTAKGKQHKKQGKNSRSNKKTRGRSQSKRHRGNNTFKAMKAELKRTMKLGSSLRSKIRKPVKGSNSSKSVRRFKRGRRNHNNTNVKPAPLKGLLG
jgi:hypothetical protein